MPIRRGEIMEETTDFPERNTDVRGAMRARQPRCGECRLRRKEEDGVFPLNGTLADAGDARINN
jgi:hypothetical protein